MKNHKSLPIGQRVRLWTDLTGTVVHPDVYTGPNAALFKRQKRVFVRLDHADEVVSLGPDNLDDLLTVIPDPS